jgi:hypothetical protein
MPRSETSLKTRYDGAVSNLNELLAALDDAINGHRNTPPTGSDVHANELTLTHARQSVSEALAALNVSGGVNSQRLARLDV